MIRDMVDHDVFDTYTYIFIRETEILSTRKFKRQARNGLLRQLAGQ